LRIEHSQDRLITDGAMPSVGRGMRRRTGHGSGDAPRRMAISFSRDVGRWMQHINLRNCTTADACRFDHYDKPVPVVNRVSSFYQLAEIPSAFSAAIDASQATRNLGRACGWSL
jgi:hypothetical protein